MSNEMHLFRPVDPSDDLMEVGRSVMLLAQGLIEEEEGYPVHPISAEEARRLARLVAAADPSLCWSEFADQIELRAPEDRIERWVFAPGECMVSISWETGPEEFAAFLQTLRPAAAVLRREGYYIADLQVIEMMQGLE